MQGALCTAAAIAGLVRCQAVVVVAVCVLKARGCTQYYQMSTVLTRAKPHVVQVELY
jgi:hypothetical protein